jgi:hypothetical protein
VRFDEYGTILEPACFPLAGLELRIPAGARIAASTDGAEIAAAGDDDPIGVSPTGEQGDRGVARSVRVQTSGPEAGVITFGADIPVPALAASLRYFYSAPGTGPETLHALRFPLFASRSSVPVEARLHPGRPDDPAVNSIAIAANVPVPTCFTTTSGQRVQLAIVPGKSQLVPQWDPVAGEAYPAPDGDWQLFSPTGASGPGADVVLGLSGLEFARAATPSTMSFVAGSPSYANGFGPSGASGAVSLTASCPGSKYPVTTAWAYFSDAPGPSGLAPGYYSQPREAGMFSGAAGDPVLAQLAVRAAKFPPGPGVLGSPAASFPTAPYAAATGTSPPAGDWSRTLSLFEEQVLTPERARAIEKLNPQLADAGPAGVPSTPAPLGTSGMTASVVTPQGLLSELSTDFTEWFSLLLAKTSESPNGVALSNIDGRLRIALLSNQLFLVISDPNALKDHVAPTAYRVTDEVLTEAAARKVPQKDLDAVRKALLLERFGDLWQFERALQEVLGPDYAQYGPVFVELSAAWELTIDQWTFDLMPSRWSSGDRPTIAIVKFCDADLATMAADWHQWTEASAFNKDPLSISKVLQDTVKDAAAGGAYFADTVIGDWNGVLFLNVPVEGDSFPPELRGLAAGIEGRLLAHHVGVNGAPIDTTSGLTTGDSSVFALIDYRNPGDLSYEGRPYAFKVLSLRVEFANSHIAGFSSLVELLVGALFGERSSIVDGEHGDNMLFEGTMQRHGAETSFSFRSSGASLLTVQSSVIGTVTLDSGEFATLVKETQADRVVSVFKLGGTVRFAELRDFDMFSFGPPADQGAPGAPGLSVSNLVVRMSATGSGVTQTVDFAFVASDATIDRAASVARPRSLYARFPLAVSAILQGDAATQPSDAGYMPVGSPLTAGPLGGTWFGLAMDLDLGSAGGLASKGELTASLLAAWSPSADAYDAQVGLRLPGSQGGSTALTLMGPLRIDIGKILFLRDPGDEGYLLRFENIALAFLGVRFPPNGRTNLLLFGNPDPTAQTNRLGWYGAYRKNPDAKDQGGGGKAPPALPALPARPAPRALPAPEKGRG